MADRTRRRVLAALGGTVAVGLAGCSQGGDSGATPTETDAMTETETTDGMDDEMTEGDTDGEMDGNAHVRVAHLSPDAPNVDVYVDGSAVLEDVAFTDVSGYLELAPGTHTVEITAAGDMSTSVFEQDLELAAADYTIAAAGELAEDGKAFSPLVLEDNRESPGENMSRVRLVHAAPDAPAVDVTVNATGAAIFDDVAYGETSSTTVEANDYTIQVRAANENNDGQIVLDQDISLNGGTGYTVFAAGYLSPDDEPTDEALQLVVAQDTQ
ncbi:DUF4397 domain-containing protein [Halorientalis regularis]|uniref:DUF4397 domain-containing protein n=1 Tax=Halorientalis regularis TaxID=660518 RepID=A0A1G7NU96_9EURY|nr:DUF4397 domain-containing protein [Halorientalis regularis]SDF77616.1 protein of unknown function [Halorientalis regularis]